jgi:hypothetical protein
LLPFSTHYIFQCGLCGDESLELKSPTWKEIALTALANICLEKSIQEGKNLVENEVGEIHVPRDWFFIARKEVAPWIQKHWDVLCYGKSQSINWYGTVGR